MGGTGDDQLFGESKGEMEDLITAGETAQNINEKETLFQAMMVMTLSMVQIKMMRSLEVKDMTSW